MTPSVPPHGRWALIREERLRCAYETVEACSAATGIPAKRIAALEGGSMVEPSFKELTQLANAGFDLNYILTGMRTLNAKEAALLENYRGSNDAGRRALRQVGSALAKPLSGSVIGEGRKGS